MYCTEPTASTTPSATTTTGHTTSVEATQPSTTFQSTPPREIDNPTPTGFGNTTGESRVSFDSKNEDDDDDGDDDEDNYKEEEVDLVKEEDESKEMSDDDDESDNIHNDIHHIDSNMPRGSGGRNNGARDSGTIMHPTHPISLLLLLHPQ